MRCVMRSGSRSCTAASRRAIRVSRPVDTCSVYRLEFGERPLDAVQERGLERDALPEIAQQVGDREAAGFLEQPPRGERAGGVGKLRLRAGESAEAGLQRA